LRGFDGFRAEEVNRKTVKLSGGEYHPVLFPDAFSAEWVRLVPSVSCKMTAEFMFT
jgi:hypothetical protein